MSAFIEARVLVGNPKGAMVISPEHCLIARRSGACTVRLDSAIDTTVAAQHRSAMKRILLSMLLASATCLTWLAQAEEAAKVLRAAVALDENTRPATKFSGDAPQLVIFFIGDGVKIGEKVRAVWIGEDVGIAAPKNTKIAEDTVPITEEKQTGSFTLSRPKRGWPVGKYRVELFVNDKLAETVKFEVEAAK
jgi:hypothetical protein